MGRNKDEQHQLLSFRLRKGYGTSKSIQANWARPLLLVHSLSAANQRQPSQKNKEFLRFTSQWEIAYKQCRIQERGHSYYHQRMSAFIASY